jgi:hypothetical protein
MKEKNDAMRFDCPVCGENIVNFHKEESFSGICPHIALSYSQSLQDFCDIDESLEEAVDEMRETLEEHEGDDDYEDITLIDLVAEYAGNSNGKYALYSIDDPTGEPHVYETIYFLIKMAEEKKHKRAKKVKTS